MPLVITEKVKEGENEKLGRKEFGQMAPRNEKMGNLD